MTYAPATLTALARYWVSQGGVNLGIVGDVAHQRKGTSYHLGRDKLAAGAYSVATERDRAGLTNAASALDLGKLNGNLGQLRAFSRWLVARVQQNAIGTSDIREIIYSPDGKTVWRWDRERGYASAPVQSRYVNGGWTQGDRSHTGHSHISFYRDSEKRSKVGIVAPYFTLAAPDTSTAEAEKEDDVQVIVVREREWPAPRRFTASAGLRRFTAIGELAPLALGYAGWADADVSIESPIVPRGVAVDAAGLRPFLRLSSGGSAGNYVLTSQVALEA